MLCGCGLKAGRFVWGEDIEWVRFPPSALLLGGSPSRGYLEGNFLKKFIVAIAAIAAVFAGVQAVPAQATSTVAPVTQSVAKIQVVGKADGSVVTTVNGQTVAAPMATDTVTGGVPWTGSKFGSRYICAQNNIGLYWNISQALPYFESGTNTVVLDYKDAASFTQCNLNYANKQIIAYGTYNTANDNCWIVSIPQTVDGVYSTGPVVVGMNLSAASASCRSTLQQRNYNISTATAYALGLKFFYSSTTLQASVMNTYNKSRYNFAGTDDRNSLYNLY